MRPTPGLERLPSEVVAHIAFEAAAAPEADGAFATGPPVTLLHLLLTSRRVYAHLAPCANPALYARVFGALFDVAPIRRRLGHAAVAPQCLADELQRRCYALQRLRRYVTTFQQHPAASDAQADAHVCEDLWIAYLIALEHDAHNLRQLCWARISEFVDLHAVQTIYKRLVQRQYPSVAMATSLALHIYYVLAVHASQGQPSAQDDDERDYLLLLLKPFVFAAQEYDLFLGPWSAHTLPLARTGKDAVAYTPSQCEMVHTCGMDIPLAVPRVSQAAIALSYMCTARSLHAASLKAQLDARVGAAVPPSCTSRAFDLDFARLRACYDYRCSPGLRLADHRGRIAGVWEGRFSFFDLDAYRDMLGGSSAALFDGTFGEQTQIVKLSEVVVCIPADGTAQYHDDVLAENRSEEHLACALQARDAETHTPAGAAATSAPLGRPQPNLARAPSEPAPPMDADTMLREWRKLPFWCDDEPTVAGRDQRELLLYGTGHSAWGKFYVRGRVRIWDGLVLLLKEYGPGRQGRWLYRGYCNAGGTLVGRWRDAYTPHGVHGYEGPFILHHRS